MRNINVLGIVFPNQYDAQLGDLTAQRALGSLPFCGRYRLIDFTLSNMVNAGISKVGLATKSNYQSLMDHLGSGKPWDLDRKNDGLYFLPTNISDTAYAGRVAALSEMLLFLSHSKEEYVLMSDCNLVGNLDYSALIRRHIETNADITVAYQTGRPPQEIANLLIHTDGDGRLCDVRIGSDGEAAFGLGLYVVRRESLLRLVEAASAYNLDSFERDVLQRRVGDLRIMGYEVPEYVMPIYSLASYFDANMAMLDPAVRREIFLPQRRIYTKVRDCAPAVYGLHSDVTDSLVADGAVIQGTLRHSIVFRDVMVGPDVTLENCIVMQGCDVRAGAHLTCVICDKDVQVGEGVTLQGAASYPVYVKKGMRV